jgi:hypothetical protein
VRLAPGQAALLQHVGDQSDEGRVAVHPLAQFLHGHRAIQGVQRLDERRRDPEALCELLGLPDDPPDQLEEAASDLDGLLLCGGLIGHCAYSRSRLLVERLNG